MKKHLLFSMVLALSVGLVQAEEEQPCPEQQQVFPIDQVSKALGGAVELTRAYIKQNPDLSKLGFGTILRLESNFTAPVKGKDPYFAIVAYNPKDLSKFYFRDELIAEAKVDEEMAHPDDALSFLRVPMNNVKSEEGATLLKQLGAYVKLHSPNFDPETGGDISIELQTSVFGLGSPKKIPLNVYKDESGEFKVRYKGENGEWVKFDTVKINANRGGIATGIKSFELKENGQTAASIPF